MPSENMVFSPRHELLTLEEMAQLLTVFESLGIEKVRITGGEPFMRKNIMQFLEQLSESKQIKDWHITTNGVLMLPHIPRLKLLGISGVNLSLDTLQRDRFQQMTRRDDFQTVWSALESLIEHGISVKINAVVQKGVNDDELVAMAALAKDYPIEMRFIEFMPFNGGNFDTSDFLSESDMIDKLSQHYQLNPVVRKHGDTAQRFTIDGFKGSIGTIAAFTRSFCGSCNRLRIDAKGQLRNCLYGQSEDVLKSILRSGSTTEDIEKEIKAVIERKPKDGLVAENQVAAKDGIHESMSTIGG